MMPVKPVTDENIERILKSKTTIDPITNCWLFTTSLTGYGYGRIKYNYKDEMVHRISAHLYLDYDLENTNFQVNHKLECPNKNCWNPEHLYIGTQAQNNVDAVTKGRNRLPTTHCPKGHEFTAENTHLDKRGYKICKKCNRERAKNKYREVHLIPESNFRK